MSTAIQWTDETWNPVTGCTKVSAGCKNCYAEKVAERFWKDRKFTDVRCHPDRLDQPLKWKKPRRIFVNSMSDLFHESVPDLFIVNVLNVCSHATHHQFQILTKRPERMRRLADMCRLDTWPNIWLGVSVEDQVSADERIPILLQTPAAVRFVSVEPLLEPVRFDPAWLRSYRGSPIIDWVIVGGESGPAARFCRIEWLRDIVAQCQAHDVRCFVKQVGARCLLGNNQRLKTTHHKGGEPSEWPEDLRVREYPR